MTTTISRLDSNYPGEIKLIAPVIRLDDDMVWTDEFAWHSIVVTATNTVGEGLQVQEYEKPSEEGRPITLETAGGMGFQRKKTVEKLKQAENILGARWYLEIWHNEKSLLETVRFRSEGVEFYMEADLSGLRGDNFWYSGTIKMAVVEW